jgi:acyl-CoA synthetase (AMP-forming)/AMP-acid ligase II
MILGRLYENHLKSNPEKTALFFQGDSYTYADLDRYANDSANALLGMGIGKGDRVALFMRNCTELIGLYFACFKIGAIAVPLNNRYVKDEAVYAVNQCTAGILIADCGLYPRVEGMGSSAPSVKHMFTISEFPGGGVRSWESVIRSSPVMRDLPRVNDGDTAMILYTSGSTSKPKGVTYTHKALFKLSESRSVTQELAADDVGLVVTAVCHLGGSGGVCFPLLYAGGSVVIMEGPDPALFLEYVGTYRPTRTLLLPAQLIDVLDHPKSGMVDFSCFKEVECGGDYISSDLYEHFRAVTGFELNQIYGLTECEGVCFTPPSMPVKRGSIGVPRDGIEIRLVDHEGREAEIGEAGEIRIKSESTMSGYWSDEENTSLVLRDGYLLTGDTGKRDESGYYYYMGRIKEIIIKGGSNVSPGEVEEVLDDHPDVTLSGVVGVPDKHYGQLIHAFIELKPGLKDAPDEGALKSYASERLAAYKVPDYWTFVDGLPRNEVGKIDRRGLHALAGRLDVSS